MNMEIHSKRKKEETEAVASNNAVRSKRKKKMNKEETDAVALRTSNKVRNYLNHDIIIFILSKLPLKSLKRFECACKLWATLFQDSYFKTIYTNNFISNNNNNHYDDTYLVPEPSLLHAHFYLLLGQRFEDRVKIDWPSPFQEDNRGICVLGAVSINGILCLNQYNKSRLVLWNPTTGEFKVIPYSICELPPNYLPACHLHGFGYDHITNDYKVLQFVDSYLDEVKVMEEFVYEDRSTDETFWMIYSLRSKSWRKLDLNLPNCYVWMIYSLRSKSWRKLDLNLPNCYAYRYEYRRVGEYTNGVFHWWARTFKTYDSPYVEEYLLSFNFSNELMFTTPSPSYLDVRRCGNFVDDRCLVLLKESIALISTNLKIATIDISILGELGIRESWTKLFTVTCLPGIGYPIGVGNLNNTVLFKKNDNKLVWVDLKTKMMEELDVKLKNGGACYVGKYKKSFLLMGEMNN